MDSGLVTLGVVLLVGVFALVAWIAFLESQVNLTKECIFLENFEVSKTEVDAVISLHANELISTEEARIYLGIGG